MRVIGAARLAVAQIKGKMLCAGMAGAVSPSEVMAWDLVRSTFDERRRRQAAPQPCAKRGPKTRYTDDQLTGDIRRTIQASRLHAEG